MFEPRFLGAVTMGERGQIVIPAEARSALNLKTGDKLLVMSGPMGNGLIIMQPNIVEEMTKKMTANIEIFKNFNKEGVDEK